LQLDDFVSLKELFVSWKFKIESARGTIDLSIRFT